MRLKRVIDFTKAARQVKVGDGAVTVPIEYSNVRIMR